MIIVFIQIISGLKMTKHILYNSYLFQKKWYLVSQKNLIDIRRSDILTAKKTKIKIL